MGARQAALHAAVAARRHRRARARAAPAPPRRGRAGRRRPVGGLRLGVRRARPRRPPAHPGRRLAPQRGDAAQPDVRGHVGHAHDAARLAAGRGAAQPRAGDGRPALVRDRRGLPRPAARPASAPPPSSAASRCRRRATTSAPCSAARCDRRRGARASRRTADFYAAKAVLAALLDALRVPWSVERASEPFLHPGARPRACWSAAATPAGSARSTRRSRARGTSTTRPASSSTSA